MNREMKDLDGKKILKKFTIFSVGACILVFGFLMLNTIIASGDILSKKSKKLEKMKEDDKKKVSSLGEGKEIEDTLSKEEMREAGVVNKRENGGKVKKVEVKKDEVKNDKEKVGEKKSKEKKRKKEVIKKTATKKKKSDKRETLIIGDSLAYAMSLNNTYTGVDKKNDYYWLTEGGVSIDFIPENLKITLGKVMKKATTNTFTSLKQIDLVKEIKEKEVKNVAILLGINGSSEQNAKKTVERMTAIKEKTGCKVFYISALPIIDAKARKYEYSVVDSNNKKYNSWVREGMRGKDLIYVDSYNKVKNYASHVSYTTDGIHYRKEVYNKVIELLEEEIRKDLETEEKIKEMPSESLRR